MRLAAPARWSLSARKVLAAVAASPDTTPVAVAEATGLAPSSAAYHLDRLRSSGLLVARREGPRLRYRTP